MSAVRDLIAVELAEPVDERVTAIAATIAAAHGKASRAVLFYGSCLRQRQLDGLMLDFYLIVSNYRLAYEKRWLASANRLIPPNVFYIEHEGMVAKYAVVSDADFRRAVSRRAKDASIIARFAQPSRLVWASDQQARDAAVDAVAEAAPNLLALARPAIDPARAADPLDLWTGVFDLTFASELRAERAGRPRSFVEAYPDRYRRITAALAADLGEPVSEEQRCRAEKFWRAFQRRSKRIQVARLAKASLTFAGGADYIIWKINRHAGTALELTPWQRRHPVLAGLSLLPRLLKSGAVR